jgi:hypothetical protein
MNELSEIVFSVLFGLLGLYIVVFWGMGIASLVCSYVHDGEKDYKSFYTSPKWLSLWGVGKSYDYNARADSFDVKCAAGILHPVIAFSALFILAIITEEGGGAFLLNIIGFIISAWAVLRITRTVVRLSKRLVAHEKNSDAHK